MLVRGLVSMEFYDDPYIGNVIIPTDEAIIFRGVGIPPTRGIWREFLGYQVLGNWNLKPSSLCFWDFRGIY